MNWGWLDRNLDTVLEDLTEHVQIAVTALVLGVLIAFPIGLAAYRWRAAYPPLLALTQVLYTIPSLALFVLLINAVGIGQTPVIIGLTIYSLVILVRNLVEGLRGVPPQVIDAATAMGYRQTRRLFAVELPIALPAIVAGLRVAAVSNISLVSVGALIGTGGLGQLFIHGFQIDNPIEIYTGIVVTILLALVVDLLIVGGGRLLTPWTRAVKSHGRDRRLAHRLGAVVGAQRDPGTADRAHLVLGARRAPRRADRPADRAADRPHGPRQPRRGVAVELLARAADARPRDPRLPDRAALDLARPGGARRHRDPARSCSTPTWGSGRSTRGSATRPAGWA